MPLATTRDGYLLQERRGAVMMPMRNHPYGSSLWTNALEAGVR